MGMDLTRFLQEEWRPALGCTEPAAVAHAAALAAGQGRGALLEVHLQCDPRTYKNCFAVGLPNTGGRTGILWALALGACLPDGSLGLRSFEGVGPTELAAAAALLAGNHVHVEVLGGLGHLFIEARVVRAEGSGVARIEHDHGRVVRVGPDGGPGEAPSAPGPEEEASARAWAAERTIPELVDLALGVPEADRLRLREGIALNLAICQHGLGLLPTRSLDRACQESLTRLSRLVSAGVYARMSGEALPVMTLSGSGNKGITASVPVALFGKETGKEDQRIDQALALACLLTASATHRLGTLSSVCGAANAAGIGVAGAVVLLEGGDAQQVGLAISSMVGNVAGMICDGAKMGCALKTMTGVDAAFRAASLALAGIGIPGTDGIVGEDGEGSLRNLGRLAQQGMRDVDAGILAIMGDKLAR